MKNRLLEAWRKPAILLVLIGLGAALRLTAIGRDSLWFDEAVSYLAANLPLAQIFNNTVQSSHPPAYYLLLAGWMKLVPDGDGWLRLLGVLWNLALIPMVYALTMTLIERRSVAAWAALLVTLSPFHILFGHELRMYTQLMFLVTAGVFAFAKAIRSEGRGWWLLFLFLSLAAIYTHMFAWLVLLGIGLYCLFRYGLGRTTWLVIGAGLLLMVIYGPWLLQLATESQRDLGSMRPLVQATTFNPIKPLTGLAFLVTGMSSRPLYTGLALFLTLSITIITLLEMRKARRAGEAGGLLLPGLIVLSVVGLPVTVYLFRPFFLPERTLAAASPFLMILLAWGTTRQGSPLPILVGATAFLMVAGTILYLAGGRVKPPYDQVVALIEEGRRDGDWILHSSDGSYLPALRYVNYDDHALLEGDPDPRKPPSVYENLGGEIWSRDLPSDEGRRLWLVVATEHSVDWQLEQLAYFNGRYRKLETYNIAGIGVYLYDLESPAPLDS